MSDRYQRVTPAQFARWFHCRAEDLDPAVLAILEKVDTRHRRPTSEEYLEHVMNYLPLLKEDWIVRDTAANQAAWLKGWTQNLEEVLTAGPSADSCKPKYFRGSKFFRLERDIVVTPNPQLEHDLFQAARLHLFRKFLAPFASVHEFGCGSCGNLWMLQAIFPDKIIRGYDWVEPSVKIANEIGRRTTRDVAGTLFDMLNPPAELSLGPTAAVLTIHALEQIGDRHGALIDLLLRARPGLVLHYEPIIEFYDDKVPFDFLARWYSEKRRYLTGLQPRLRQFQDQGRLEILWEHRPELGGVVHEASVIAWRPR